MKNLKHFNTTRSTYSSGNYSSFWLDDDFDFERKTSIFDDEEVVKPKTDLIALSSYRRAIANFVNIVTQQIVQNHVKAKNGQPHDEDVVAVNWIIMPLLNPDGYEYSRTPGHRLWRKNR